MAVIGSSRDLGLSGIVRVEENQDRYPGVLYSPVAIKVQDNRIFDAHKGKNTVVAFYLEKAEAENGAGDKSFYFSLAALNLRDLVNRLREAGRNPGPVVDNLFSAGCPPLGFFQTEGVLDTLLEAASWVVGRSNLFANISGKEQRQYVSETLYRRFEKYYDKQEFGRAKTCFYHFVCQGDVDRKKIDASTDKLEKIFTYFRDKTYVPQESFDIKFFLEGIEKLVHIDLVLFRFLHYYYIHNKIEPSKEVNRPHVVDWTLFSPHPEKRVAEWAIRETSYSIPYSKLNGLSEPFHQTCVTEIKRESSSSLTFKLDETTTRELMSKRGFENQILTKVADVKGSERGRQNDLVFQREDTSGFDEQAGVGGAHRAGRVAGSEDENVKSKSHTDQTGTEYTTSNRLCTEDGIEVAHSSAHHNERTKMDERFSETSRSSSSSSSISGGVNLGLFSLGGGSGSDSSSGSRSGDRSTEQRTEGEETKDERSVHHQHSRESSASQANSKLDETTNQRQDRRVVTQKSEVENSKTYEKKFGKRSQQRLAGERGEHANTRQHNQAERVVEGTVRNTVDFQATTSFVVARGQEYVSASKDIKADTETQTITIPPGYLLIVKVESTTSTVVRSIRETLEMGVRPLDEITFDPTPKVLNQLRGRIEDVRNRRLFQVRYVIDRKPVGSPSIKYLSLAVEASRAAGESAIASRMIKLNSLYYRLDHLLNSLQRLDGQYMARYADLRNDYIEYAGAIKHYDSARTCLEKMLFAFQKTELWNLDGFQALLSEFRKEHGDDAQLQSDAPPNWGAGALFYKREPSGDAARGLAIGSGQLTLEDSYKNLLVCGGVGSGKTSTVCIPNLLQLDDCSALVTDVSGEVYEKTHQAMRNKGFDVKVLDIQNPSSGDVFNPLGHLEASSFDEIKQTVDCIMKARGFDETKGEKDAFWVIGGKSLLELSLAILTEEKENGVRSTITLRDLFDQVVGLDQEFVSQLVQKTTSDRVRELAKGVQSGGNSFADRAAYAKSAVEYFSAPNVTDLTSAIDLTKESSIDFGSLRQKKTVIYLKIGVEQLRSYNFLLSLFYTRFFSQCYANSKVTTGKEGLPIFCLMDEFGHTPIPGFQETIATLRKHEVSVTAMVQAVSQLKELYGEDNARTIMQGGFTSKLYFALDTSEVDVAKQITESCGKVVKNRKTLADGKASFAEQDTDALPIEKIMYPGANRATFMHAGHEPVQLELVPYYKNQKLRSLMESCQVRASATVVRERLAVVSKEEAITALIGAINEKMPDVQTAAIKVQAGKTDNEAFRALLERKKVPIGREPFRSLFEQITANRSDLFAHVKYVQLAPEGQKEIREAYDKARLSDKDNSFIDLLEFIETVVEKGFTIGEVACLREQISELFHKSRPELTKAIQDLVVDRFMVRKNLSKEEVQQGLPEPWNTDVATIVTDLVRCLVENAHADPETKGALKRLTWAKLTGLFHEQSPQLDKVLVYYAGIAELPPEIVRLQVQFNENPQPKVLIVEGSEWIVERNEEKVGGLIRELAIKHGDARKTIKFHTKTLETKVFVPQAK